MFGAKQLLGTLVSSGLGGAAPVRAGPSAGSGNLAGGGLGKAASLALLGTLAYKAYQSYQQRRDAAPVAQPVWPGPVTPSPEQGDTADRLSDSDAKTLIRAMVAAANADGHVDAQEEQRIHRVLAQAGASAEDRHFVADAIRSPAGIDELVGAARDPEMASHIYAASLLGMGEHSTVNQAYLRYLASRLSLDDATIAALHRAVGAPALS